MDFLTNPEFWAKWGAIVLLDLVLAGDNALVIALAVRRLPEKQQFWGRVWGTLGAVILRMAFIAAVTWLLTIPFLRVIGGLFLVWIAYKLVAHCPDPENEKRRPGATLREAIGIIILADVVMSLDNVMAISAAARGDLVLVIFGLLFSLPLVVWGSGLLARLMNRLPLMIWLGGGVLGWVAMKMILDDPWVLGWLGDELSHALHYAAPGVLAVALAVVGWWFSRTPKRCGDAG
jgi:YjbE family integral membrane protein